VWCAGEDARLFDTVRLFPNCARRSACRFRSARIRCRCAPPGKISGVKKQVVSPLSLVVTSFAAVDDVRKTKTPQLAVDQGETDILLLDLGKNRLGGSAAGPGLQRHRQRCPGR
jgi:phosphoribosylformylglycinamidine synthase